MSFYGSANAMEKCSRRATLRSDRMGRLSDRPSRYLERFGTGLGSLDSALIAREQACGGDLGMSLAPEVA
jgi:hypothetical protein